MRTYATHTHTHTYRSDIADMWCEECETVTDYCQELNPFDKSEED